MGVQYAIARVGENHYALEISKIEQLVNYSKPTKLAGSPDSMVGVINYFDKLWSIIDLKQVYNKETIKETDEKKLIILLVCKAEQKRTGLLVEEVQSVEEIEESDIRPLEIEKKNYSVINLKDKIVCIIEPQDIFEKIQEEYKIQEKLNKHEEVA